MEKKTTVAEKIRRKHCCKRRCSAAPVMGPLVTYPLEIVVPEARHQTPAVGQRATRLDCRLHGLGQTKYIDDMTFPGMLYARIKRAGIASARITSIDTSKR